MKNILILTSELRFSGPNNVILSLLEGMDKKEDKVFLSSLRVVEDKKFISEIDTDRVDIISQKSKSSFIHLLRLIKETTPDVINTHGIRADLFVFILSFFFKFKQFSTIHNLPNEDYIMRYGNVLGNIMLLIHSFLFRSLRAKKIAVSKYSKNNLISSLNAKNTTYIYNGVNEDKYKPLDENNKNLVCKSLGLSLSRKKVVFCGHLTDIKDPLTVASIASDLPSVDFIFLGDGPLKENLREISHSNIHLFGRVNNVRDYLAVADVFIMPSKTEGMPMALIEAMLMNLPLVCSDIPIFNELAELDKIDLKIFKQDDKSGLINAISSALSLSFCSNRDVALKNFTSDIMSNKYLEVFNE